MIAQAAIAIGHLGPVDLLDQLSLGWTWPGALSDESLPIEVRAARRGIWWRWIGLLATPWGLAPTEQTLGRAAPADGAQRSLCPASYGLSDDNEPVPAAR